MSKKTAVIRVRRYNLFRDHQVKTDPPPVIGEVNKPLVEITIDLSEFDKLIDLPEVREAKNLPERARNVPEAEQISKEVEKAKAELVRLFSDIAQLVVNEYPRTLTYCNRVAETIMSEPIEPTEPPLGLLSGKAFLKKWLGGK